MGDTSMRRAALAAARRLVPAVTGATAFALSQHQPAETCAEAQSGARIPGEVMRPRTKKREDYISWNDYFMSIAMLSSMRSKDPSTQVGACIVNSNKKIVGIGYNGFPNSCSDDELPWDRTSVNGDQLDTKYPYVVHAECNAIMNKNAESLQGCTMYVALFPCNECTKMIIQSGIKKVYFLSDKYHDVPAFVASRRMLDMAGVEYVRYVPSKPSLTITFPTDIEAGIDATASAKGPIQYK